MEKEKNLKEEYMKNTKINKVVVMRSPCYISKLSLSIITSR